MESVLSHPSFAGIVQHPTARLGSGIQWPSWWTCYGSHGTDGIMVQALSMGGICMMSGIMLNMTWHVLLNMTWPVSVPSTWGGLSRTRWECGGHVFSANQQRVPLRASYVGKDMEQFHGQSLPSPVKAWMVPFTTRIVRRRGSWWTRNCLCRCAIFT
jgi:hypothetical protein